MRPVRASARAGARAGAMGLGRGQGRLGLRLRAPPTRARAAGVGIGRRGVPGRHTHTCRCSAACESSPSGSAGGGASGGGGLGGRRMALGGCKRSSSGGPAQPPGGSSYRARVEHTRRRPKTKPEREIMTRPSLSTRRWPKFERGGNTEPPDYSRLESPRLIPARL